jgi:hypothetical protein
MKGEADPVTLISINAFGGGPAIKMQGDSERHNYLHPSMMVVMPSEKDLQTPPICLGEEPSKNFNPNNGLNWLSFLNIKK